MTAEASGKILVLEDDRTSARAVAHLLEEAGHSVKTAFRAAQAIEIAARWEPDLLLTDILLDGARTGFDVAAVLGGERMENGLAVVVMTGLTKSDVKRHRGDREVFAVLHKPLVPSELERTVSRALAARGRRRAGDE